MAVRGFDAMLNNQQAREILANAELLHNADAVQAALHHVAARINTALADRHPLVLSVMGGAVVLAGSCCRCLIFRWTSIICTSRATAMISAAANCTGRLRRARM